MTIRLLVGAALILGAAWSSGASGETSPSPASSPAPSAAAPSPSPSPSPRLAPFKERLAAAKSVKVQTGILGVELDASLEMAHARIDPLTDTAQRPVKADEGEEGEGEEKVLWKLAKSDFDSVFVKADKKGRISYILGSLRAGKEIAFDKIGEVEKAPIRSESVVAWDVVRPNRPLIRVVARGSNRKASSITIFVAKRAATDRRDN